jgi:hypothetical protein
MTFHILTVGDGDLSLSLALIRAYQHESQSQSQSQNSSSASPLQVQVTASTLLPCEEDLLHTYPQSAPSNLHELRERKCEVIYNVDATQLHQYQNGLDGSRTPTTAKNQWDCIVFYHAHLGDDELRDNNEGAHAERHYRLLAHYLASAASRVRRNDDDNADDHDHDPVGRVHLCLCGKQAETWRLRDAADAAGLLLVQQQSAQEPFHKLWSSSSSRVKLEACPSVSGWGASRRSRNGRAGSRDWLGKYGYRHRRTHGDGAEADAKDVDLSGATHYLFATPAPATKGRITNKDIQGQLVDTAVPASFECHICRMKCANSAELQAHLQAPALPDAPTQMAKVTKKKISDFSQSTNERPTSGIGSSKLAGNTPVHSDVAALPSDNDVADVGSTTTAATSTGGSQTVVVSSHNEGKRLRWYIQREFFAVEDHCVLYMQCVFLLSCIALRAELIVALYTSIMFMRLYNACVEI